MKSADLHMHTTASDGTDTLKERIKDAKEKDIDAIAITDHDTVNKDLEERSFTSRNGVEVITGSEIKCEFKGRKIEILAYFIDPEEKEIQELFNELSQRRENRMEKFVNNLNSSRDLDLELGSVLDRSNGNVGRPHLAEELIHKGLVKTHEEAFEKFIGSQHEEYVAVEKISAGKVIEKVHENGGVTSLAHPGRSLRKEEAEETVKGLARKGLDAVEVDYTYDERREKSSYDIYFGEDKARELAERFELLSTGGTDCHGSRSDKYYLGRIKIPYEKVEKLREKCEGDF